MNQQIAMTHQNILPRTSINHLGITSTYKMAAEGQSADKSEQVISSRRKESKNEHFMPKDTLDQPCDVVLIVKDGREVKAHRRVLSEASPFFEKLLNSDMKETQEGVVRLEMFTESVMAGTLQFIYTGDLQILAEDNARDLIVVADYLFLDKLKLLAGEVLLKTLNTSNCISTYYFAERYQCEDLISGTRKFFHANFSSIYAASREDVLNMSSREAEMCISSDEIDVSAEEDVFMFILAWIDHDRSRRKKYFVELFRHVRLVYVSRDFLRTDIETNELVQDNNSSVKLVQGAMNLMDSLNCDNFFLPPRKSLEIPVIVVNASENILCYFPREDSWCKLGEIPREIPRGFGGNFVPCDGQLYRTVQEWSDYGPQCLKQITYNPYSNSWMQLPSLEETRRYLRKIFVGNGNEMYALMSEQCVMTHLTLWSYQNGQLKSEKTRRLVEEMCGSRRHTSFLMQFNPESKSWQDVTSFDHFDLRQDFSIVTNDNFIYFIGGMEWPSDECTFLSDVDRYDMSKHQWDKVADIQMARKWAHGAGVNEKIYIAGGVFQGSLLPESCQCEVYDETTNEWQFIRSFVIGNRTIETLLAVDGELYGLSSIGSFSDKNVRIDYYNPKKNEWTRKTRLKILRERVTATIMCSMKIFKGLFNIRPMVEAFPAGSFSRATTTQPSFYLPRAPERK